MKEWWWCWERLEHHNKLESMEVPICSKLFSHISILFFIQFILSLLVVECPHELNFFGARRMRELLRVLGSSESTSSSKNLSNSFKSIQSPLADPLLDGADSCSVATPLLLACGALFSPSSSFCTPDFYVSIGRPKTLTSHNLAIFPPLPNFRYCILS